MARVHHALPGVLAALVWFGVAQVWPRPLSFTWQAYWPDHYLILGPRGAALVALAGTAAVVVWERRRDWQMGSVAAAGLTVAAMWLLVGASIGLDMESTLYDPHAYGQRIDELRVAAVRLRAGAMCAGAVGLAATLAARRQVSRGALGALLLNLVVASFALVSVDVPPPDEFGRHI